MKRPADGWVAGEGEDSPQAEDDSGRETHVALSRRLSGARERISEPGEHVFGPKKTHGDVAAERDVDSAACSHGERVLGRKRRANRTARTAGDGHITGVHASEQILDERSDPAAPKG